MAETTKIRWAGSTLNFFTGCDRVSEGCGKPMADEPRPPGSGCYAEALANRYKGGPAWPVGFDLFYRPHQLKKIASWKEPRRVFVNSLSDFNHKDAPDEWRDAGMSAFMEHDRHQYLILTKRPERMLRYFDGWLARNGLERVPHHIWLGTSIELAKYNYRADVMREIPVDHRFISAEPLLGPLRNVCANCAHILYHHHPEGCRDCTGEACVTWAPAPGLDLTGISWLIVGGESGPGYRPMDVEWARDLRDLCALERVAFFYKQGAAIRTEMDIRLDGELYEEFPEPLPVLGQVGLL